MNSRVPGELAQTIHLEHVDAVGLDPRVEEASWVAFNVTDLPHGHQRSVGTDLRQIASAIWSFEIPVALVSEFRLPGGAPSGPSMSTVAVGVYGAAGDSAANVVAIGAEIQRVLKDRVGIVPTNPSALLSPPEAPYAFRMCQAPVRPLEHDGFEIPTIWHVFPNPQRHLATTAAAMDKAMRIRTTYLSTTPSVEDLAYLDRGARYLADVLLSLDTRRVDHLRLLERAMASYRCLANRLEGPLWIGEVAVASASALSWSQRQLLSGCLTSAPGLHWSEDGPQTIDSGPLRGGCETQDLDPQDLLLAHRSGLPVHGGLRPRRVHDLFAVADLLWDIPPAETDLQLELFPEPAPPARSTSADAGTGSVHAGE